MEAIRRVEMGAGGGLTLLPSLVFFTLHVPSESFSKNFLAFGARSIM